MQQINISRKGLSIMVISATLSLSTILCYSNEANAYEIFIDNRLVAYVDKNEKAMAAVNSLSKEVQDRFGTSSLKDSLTIKKVRVDEDYITEEGKIKDTIRENSDLLVDAYAVAVDNKILGVVASEKEGKEALEKLKSYYISKSGLEPKNSSLITNISYKKERTVISKVDTPEQVANTIEEANSKQAKPIVAFQITGIRKTTEVISPAVTTQWSDDMTTGQSKVLNNGKEGQKIVEREIALENTKVTGSKVLSEKIISAAQNKIVVQGRKNPVLASIGPLQTPSRGAISSYFGMRWGKMHEGLDIAANMGESIKAALDGVVVYSGWEEGYGNVIKLQHQNGLMTVYGHCSKLEVTDKQSVKKGDEIGLVGSTGNSTGPHLHFEVRLNGVPQNPVAYLN